MNNFRFPVTLEFSAIVDRTQKAWCVRCRSEPQFYKTSKPRHRFHHLFHVWGVNTINIVAWNFKVTELSSYVSDTVKMSNFLSIIVSFNWMSWSRHLRECTFKWAIVISFPGGFGLWKKGWRMILIEHLVNIRSK